MEKEKPNIFEIVVSVAIPVLILFFVFFFIGFLTSDFRSAFILAWALSLLSIVLLRSRHEKVFGISKSTLVEVKNEGLVDKIWNGMKAVVYIIIFFAFPFLWIFVELWGGNREKLFDTSAKTNKSINLLLSCIFLLIIYLIGNRFFPFILALVALLTVILYFAAHYDVKRILRVITVTLSIILLVLVVYVYIIFSYWFMPR